jgi:hypothetical protein
MSLVRGYYITMNGKIIFAIAEINANIKLVTSIKIE